jgi:3-oxoacyl-[acyl-carrier protein] reductase
MRNVVVTGGSRGLGLGIARRLVASGYRVLAIARRENKELCEARAEAETSTPGSFVFHAFDLSETGKFPALVSHLRRGYGSIYGLVNNAGIGFDGSLALMPPSQIEQLLLINTISPILLTRSVVRSMMADGGGRIVNMASVTAFSGYSGLSVYSATKAALVGFTRSLAREVGRAGITVNAVAPGFVSTDLTHAMTDEQRQNIERRSALKRLIDVEDVANAVEFLLSDKAKNITGAVLTVDAGSTA